MPSRVEWTERAGKDYAPLDRKTKDRIRQAVERLAATGHGDVCKIEGSATELRLRVGNWRVFFELVGDERTVRVLNVRPRGSAYRDK